jgi:hypothetical protein
MLARQTYSCATLQFVGGDKTPDECLRAVGTIFDAHGELANQLRRKKVAMVTVDTSRIGAEVFHTFS